MNKLERPDDSNYFRFYGLEESFEISQNRLKQLFLEKSKLYHPDFYINQPESQHIALSASALNNLAYKTLSNEISRVQYLCSLNGDQSESNPALPIDFLSDMMDLNEAIL